MEQTGSCGAGLTRHLALAGVPVLEVTGPEPGQRRAKGRSLPRTRSGDDRLDAIAAARAALEGRRVQVAKDRSGAARALRVLRTTRATPVKARRAARPAAARAPSPPGAGEVREPLRHLTRMQLIRTCAGSRPDATGLARALSWRRASP